jgi:hypothetical protein
MISSEVRQLIRAAKDVCNLTIAQGEYQYVVSKIAIRALEIAICKVENPKLDFVEEVR